MTNADRIRAMSDEELAKTKIHNIRSVIIIEQKRRTLPTA